MDQFVGVRMDRFLLNSHWILKQGCCISNILTLTGSNHFVVALEIEMEPNVFRPRPYFKLEQMWFMDKEFIWNCLKNSGMNALMSRDPRYSRCLKS